MAYVNSTAGGTEIAVARAILSHSGIGGAIAVQAQPGELAVKDFSCHFTEIRHKSRFWALMHAPGRRVRFLWHDAGCLCSNDKSFGQRKI
jgi:hypothetical protein